MDNRERTAHVEHDHDGIAEKIFPDYGATPERDAEVREGDRVTVDPAMADEEVVPVPTRDQGRETEQPKEPQQRQQIFPDN